MQEIVRRIDRLVVRTAQPAALFATLIEQLGLPPSWPLTANPFFTSGGIYLGNVNLEILQVGRPPADSRAQLYGVAFELHPHDQSLPELGRRNIPHTPPLPFIQPDESGWLVTTWNNVYLGGLLDTRPSIQSLTRAVFGLFRRVSRQRWEQGSKPNWFTTRLGVPLMFNLIYRKGMTFSVEYNPAWKEANIKNEPAFYGLEMMALREVIVGARRLDDAYRRWNRLLQPHRQIEPYRWALPDGQHICLESAREDGLVAMVWKVRSLNRAAQYLHKRGLLGQELPGMLTIAPELVGGLDIRIVA